MNQGLLNWFVTGLATSPDGLRINNGGQAHINRNTTEGLRSVVVVDDLSLKRPGFRGGSVIWNRLRGEPVLQRS